MMQQIVLTGTNNYTTLSPCVCSRASVYALFFPCVNNAAASDHNCVVVVAVAVAGVHGVGGRISHRRHRHLK